MRRISRLPIVVAAIASVALVAPTSATGADGTKAKGDPSPRHIAYDDFSSAEFATGTFDGTVATPDGVRLSAPIGQRDYTDPFGDGSTTTYDYGTWTSPVVTPDFDYTELIASWDAATPGDSWVEVQVRGTADTGQVSKWYVLGRWAAGDEHLHRTSVSAQGDDLATVAVDTLVALNDYTFTDWQLRVELYRAAGSDVTPMVASVGAMASNLPDDKKVPVSPPGGAEGIVLDVPTYSQEIHIGEYPQWDGGGEAWCSPTSTAMVLDYWGMGPTSDDTAWVDPAFEDPQVDHAARYVYDYRYDGAGNWPYNTAYATTRGLESFVTRLRSLTEAERFIKAGVPLVVSMSFKKGDLDGAGYGTNGHLMVIRGFAANGDVVANDPASHLIPSNDEVRVTYDREQFENAWLPHSGGLAYIIHPASVPLPTAPDEANW